MEAADADKQAIIRRFILNAPPGELPTVLKSLRTLTRNDELFFSTIPACCLEYSTRQFVVYTHGGDASATHDISQQTFSVMTTKHNHVQSLVRRFAKANSLKKRDVGDEVVSFFEANESVLMNPDKESESTTGFENTENVFMTTIDGQVAFVEVDPVEGGVVAVSVLGDEQLANLPAALKPAVEALLPSAGEASVDRAVKGCNPALLCAELQQSMQKYLQSSFCKTEIAGRQGHPQEDGAVSASLVFPADSSDLLDGGEESGNKARSTTLSVSVTSRNTNLKALWTGRWKSTFLVAITPPEDGSDVGASGSLAGEWGCDIIGESEAHVHYFEEGNVHMNSNREVPKLSLAIVAKSGSDEAIESQIAKKICKQLKKEESAFEQELGEACAAGGGSVGDEAIKTLRRRLPISRQLFDFNADASNLSARSWVRLEK